MRIIFKKILNRTDLAQSGSHGGLVVTKQIQKPLFSFFENLGTLSHAFQDRKSPKQYNIHYQKYTANRTTPNDRVTPIGSYAKDHDLKPGDILIFEKEETGGQTNYFVDYERKANSAYFVGKSKKKAELLNGALFQNLINSHAQNGSITKISPSAHEMQASYDGKRGTLELSCVNGQSYELYFEKSHIEEANKYFELDMSVKPFALRKTDTWSMKIALEKEEEIANDEEDGKLVIDVNVAGHFANNQAYVPVPEAKKPAKTHGGRTVPDRNPDTAARALQRAGYLCECDPGHKLFVRKNANVNYTEPHHLIPLKYDELFEFSLDVEANIISLCSHCHNLIHYGADARQELRKLWEERKDELKQAGLGKMRDGAVLGIDSLLQFYGF